MVQIVINGQTLDAEQGSMIIEAADRAGVRIPRFCYHKKLSIAANCRMCLVEVENVRKPVPACATPVTEGMKVLTRSKMALESQKAVMEFLLINHPLDCPICDQGGECELQDVSMGYGGDISRFNEGKRVIAKKDFGPLIETDLTRCIQCTRCVRFGEEIAGVREIGMLGRGEHVEIAASIEKSIESELSGNVIDVCPVGALTSKPFRFSARAWELRQYPAIAPHDCVGSNIYVHTQRNQIKRVVPRENEAVNEVWISDRDRFSYEGLRAQDRATMPMIKQNGVWREVDWNVALSVVNDKLQRLPKNQMGALCSSSATLEEMYLLQKWLRGLGVTNIDHRMKQRDFSEQSSEGLFVGLSFPLADIEAMDAILLVGSHLRKEQPLLAHRVRKAHLNGGQVFVVNPRAYEFNFTVAQQKTASLLEGLAGIAKACADLSSDLSAELKQYVANVKSNDIDASIAAQLLKGEKKAILLGALAAQHPNRYDLQRLCHIISQATGAKIGWLTEGANAAGAWLTGVVPHRGALGSSLFDYGLKDVGLNAQAMLDAKLQAYVLFNLEPDFDCLDNEQALHAMKQAECVIALSPYASESLKAYADVILPIATFAETAGTFVNVEGRWQSFKGVVEPFEQARPAWKVLRVLGNLAGLAQFDYVSCEEIRQEVEQLWQAAVSTFNAQDIRWSTPLASSPECDQVELKETPIYSVDMITRRATALQQTPDAHVSAELTRV